MAAQLVSSIAVMCAVEPTLTYVSCVAVMVSFRLPLESSAMMATKYPTMVVRCVKSMPSINAYPLPSSVIVLCCVEMPSEKHQSSVTMVTPTTMMGVRVRAPWSLGMLVWDSLPTSARSCVAMACSTSVRDVMMATPLQEMGAPIASWIRVGSAPSTSVTECVEMECEIWGRIATTAFNQLVLGVLRARSTPTTFVWGARSPHQMSAL